MVGKWSRWKGIMKCYPFEEKRLLKWEPPFIVQPKYDGVRCRALPVENGYLLLSSMENIIYSVPHINKALLKYRGLNVELDGELYCHGMSFEQILRRTSPTINLHPDHENIHYHIFDYMSDELQLERSVNLNSFEIKPPLERSPYWVCESLDDIMRIFTELINFGYEGIIVRNYLAPYVRKRSTMLMKFKPKQEDIYEIIGAVEEHTNEGTPKGVLGALVCASGDGNTFRVGTGFSDDQREYLWKIRDRLAGKNCRVKYQHITSGKAVPRFPVFADIVPRLEVIDGKRRTNKSPSGNS